MLIKAGEALPLICVVLPGYNLVTPIFTEKSIVGWLGTQELHNTLDAYFYIVCI